MLKIRLKYLQNHWKSLLSGVIKTSLVGFGYLVTLSDAFLNVLPRDTSLSHMLHTLVYLPFNHPAILLIPLLLLAIAGLIINWPHTSADYKDPQSDIKVIVECCNLFEQDGLRVVHCVDTFDTALGTIISPRSVHGAFLSLCEQSRFNINEALDTALENIQPQSLDPELPGRQKRYKLGTLCPLTIGKDDYCMVSFTHLQPNGNIAITRTEYTDFLLSMWRNLAAPTIRQDVINVAVMGNRFVDLPAEFSTEQKIDLMIQTFFAASREKTCCKTLRICVHESNVTEVNFQAYPLIIEHLSKRPIM